MNILYIHRSLTVIGGLEKILVDKMNYLADKYHYNIWFITYEQCNMPFAFNLSVKIHYCDINIPLYKIYKKNMFYKPVYYMKERALFLDRISNIISNNNIDIVVGTTYDLIVLDVINKIKDKVKTVVESHTSKKYINYSHSVKQKNITKRILYKIYDYRIRRLIKNTSKLITLTKEDSNEWNGIKQNIIIPNFLNYYPDKSPNYDVTKRHAISVGRLSIQKGYDLLLKSWSIAIEKHKDWHLDIYGEGEEYFNLIKTINCLGINSNVTIHKPTLDIYEKYYESDFYILSSRYEGFGIVLIEAMSCGIPCVAFDCPYGPSDIIKDKENGLITKEGNINSLAKNIIYMIENKKKRIEMGKNAKENVKRFLPENIMPQWKKLFESLVDDKKYKL